MAAYLSIKLREMEFLENCLSEVKSDIRVYESSERVDKEVLEKKKNFCSKISELLNNLYRT